MGLWTGIITEEKKKERKKEIIPQCVVQDTQEPGTSLSSPTQSSLQLLTNRGSLWTLEMTAWPLPSPSWKAPRTPELYSRDKGRIPQQ